MKTDHRWCVIYSLFCAILILIQLFHHYIISMSMNLHYFYYLQLLTNTSLYTKTLEFNFTWIVFWFGICFNHQIVENIFTIYNFSFFDELIDFSRVCCSCVLTSLLTTLYSRFESAFTLFLNHYFYQLVSINNPTDCQYQRKLG